MSFEENVGLEYIEVGHGRFVLSDHYFIKDPNPSQYIHICQTVGDYGSSYFVVSPFQISWSHKRLYTSTKHFARKFTADIFIKSYVTSTQFQIVFQTDIEIASLVSQKFYLHLLRLLHPSNLRGNLVIFPDRHLFSATSGHPYRFLRLFV